MRLRWLGHRRKRSRPAHGAGYKSQHNRSATKTKATMSRPASAFANRRRALYRCGRILAQPMVRQASLAQSLARMAFKTLLRLFAALAVAFACRAPLAAEPEHVDIPDGDLTLHATLYRPDGAGPFPAVVALHDCGGLIHRPHHRGAALRRMGAGSSSPTALSCCFRIRSARAASARNAASSNRKVHASRERVADANAARRWLQGAELRARRSHFAAGLVERRRRRAMDGAADDGAA